jgi:hypothetical protein
MERREMMQGLDRFITGNWGEDQFRPTVTGQENRCAWCDEERVCVLIDDPEPEVKGDRCWVCGECQLNGSTA